VHFQVGGFILRDAAKTPLLVIAGIRGEPKRLSQLPALIKESSMTAQ
jgi:hypothetical protein